MRKQKIIVIGDKSVTVMELMTSDVIALLESDEGIGMLLSASSGMTKDVSALMPKCVDISAEELASMTETASAYMLLEEAFFEVNADFFARLPAKIDRITGAAEALAKRMEASLKQRASSSGKGT